MADTSIITKQQLKQALEGPDATIDTFPMSIRVVAVARILSIQPHRVAFCECTEGKPAEVVVVNPNHSVARYP